MNHPFITIASALKNFSQQYRSALIVVCNLLLACFIISVVPCYCQDERYYIQHITSDNGLPQNSIKGLETDKNGFIWMATEMGFVRYDGKTLRVYSNTSKPVVNVKRIESFFKQAVYSTGQLHKKIQRSLHRKLGASWCKKYHQIGFEQHSLLWWQLLLFQSIQRTYKSEWKVIRLHKNEDNRETGNRTY